MTLAEKFVKEFQELNEIQQREVIDFMEFIKEKQQKQIENTMDKIIEKNKKALKELSK